MNAKQEYLARCADALQKKYGLKTILVKVIAQSAVLESWFDHLVGQEVEIAGIDLDAIPQRYLTAGGDYIPFACAEYCAPGVAEKHVHELQFVENGGVQCSTLGCRVYYSEKIIISILEQLANK